MTIAIGSVSELVKIIQSQFAQRSVQAPVRADIGSAGRSAARGDVQRKPGQLSALIELRVSKLDKDDPQRGRKAFRLFLETVLLAQFGDQLINDPKFYLLVDDVHAALERDPQVEHLIGQAIAHLLAEHSNRADHG
jgi:hypothetical protein